MISYAEYLECTNCQKTYDYITPYRTCNDCGKVIESHICQLPSSIKKILAKSKSDEINKCRIHILSYT